MRKKRVFGCIHAGTETHYHSLSGKRLKKRMCFTQGAKRAQIFGLHPHENAVMPLRSADGHYHPLNAKQQRARQRLWMKSLEKAAASGELARLMNTGDIVQGFVKPEGK